MEIRDIFLTLEFILQFDHKEDKNKVLEDGPRFIQNQLSFLKSWRHDAQLTKLEFSTILVWVQIHALSLY